MQVTKNEKIVKVLQEETYDIKGLSKAEAIAILIVLGRTNGNLLYPTYKALLSELGANCASLSYELRTGSGEIDILDVYALESKIKQLTQE